MTASKENEDLGEHPRWPSKPEAVLGEEPDRLGSLATGQEIQMPTTPIRKDQDWRMSRDNLPRIPTR